MNQQMPQKTQRGSRSEAILPVLLIVLTLFLIVFLVVFLVQGAQSEDEPTVTTPATTPSGGEEPTPVPSKPVYAGGNVPTYPAASNATVNLTPEYMTSISKTLASQYAVIIDAATGEILAGRNTNVQFSPASMTKVMTLIVACEKLTEEDLETRIEYTSYYADLGRYNGMSTSLGGLKNMGDRFLIKDLLYAIGVSSAADAVLMVAEYTYGSQEAFVDAMNQKATVLGLKGTKFVDAAGDYFPGEQYTTAEDMAVIMSYASNIPLVQDILSSKTHVASVYWTSKDKYYNLTFFSHLFENRNIGRDGKEEIDSREEYYRRDYGVYFKLDTVKDLFGKTGYLKYGTGNDKTTESYLVCAAIGKTSGRTYIVVVGDSTLISPTMADVKFLFDTYAK